MILTATCTSYLLELLDGGVHLPGDDYRLVLLLPKTVGVYDESLTRYGSIGQDELPAALGYLRGGARLTGRRATLIDGEPALDFEDAVWPAASFQTGGGVIVNASKDGRALAVLSFGGVYVGNGSAFRVPIQGPVRLARR